MATEDRDAAFGPSGYLPDRAARRARKIVLRAPLGLHWVVAALVFGVVVVVAGVVWWSSSGPPGAPFVAVGQFRDLDPVAEPLAELDALLVTAAVPPVAFADTGADDLAWCPDARRFVDGEGGVWDASGRGHGVASRARHPVVVHSGEVYVDPTTTRAGPPATGPAEPDC